MRRYPSTIWTEGLPLPLDWNGPDDLEFAPFPSEQLSSPIITLFEAMAQRYPERIAVDDGTTQLTYRSLLRAARHLASCLAQKTKPEDLIGILLPTSASFPVAMMACFAAGRLFVPMDLHYPRRWIGDVIGDAGIKAVIIRLGDADAAQLLPPELPQIDISASLAADLPGQSAVFPACMVAPDDPALVLFTSGSTGRPKGIVNSQRNLLRRVEQHVNAGHISDRDQFLPLSSDCTIAGIRERLTALLSGATLHLIDVQRTGAREIAARLGQARITIIYGVPALLRTLIQLEDIRPPDSLHIVRIGGDAVLWSDVQLLWSWLPPSCRIQLGYSSTEAPIMQWFVPRDFRVEGARVPIGYPLKGNDIAIIDEDGHPVQPGEAGELVIRSPYIALGRWVNGCCAGDDFPPDAEDRACRIQHTGDLVRLRPDGLIDLIGRKDRQIKIRGQRIEPGEVEGALLRRPDVTDAAVLVRQTEDQVALIAYIVPREEAPAALITTLKYYLKDTLPPPLQPHRIYALPQIPRLPSAKPDLKGLQAIDREKVAADAREGFLKDPSFKASDDEENRENDIEATVAAIWRRILKRDYIARDCDFFDLGGDSLSVIGMMLNIEKALGIELPVTMIYQAPTIASLSAAIEKHAEIQFSSLVLIKDGADDPPFFIIHGVGGNVMELFSLGRQIDWPGPIYAIQARGLDGREEPLSSIQAMADYYWAAIRSLQPQGPYFISGYSYGGLIAFALACQAKIGNDEIALVALLDTITNPRQWPLASWMGRFYRRRHLHEQRLRALQPSEALSYFYKIGVSLSHSVRWRLGLGAVEHAHLAVSGLPPALARVRNAMIEAAADYRPGFYDGVVTLLKADPGDPDNCDPVTVWKNCAQTLRVQTVPGDHRTMIGGENGRILARFLSEILAEAVQNDMQRPAGPVRIHAEPMVAALPE